MASPGKKWGWSLMKANLTKNKPYAAAVTIFGASVKRARSNFGLIENISRVFRRQTQFISIYQFESVV
jgi:hypothetical protein